MKYWWMQLVDRWNELVWQIWKRLPDECEADYCEKQGIRGNEQMVHGVILCDYCYARYRKDGQIMAKKRFYDYDMECARH